MGQAESNESAAVKRQAEGGAIPMYELLDLGGMKFLFLLTVCVKFVYSEKAIKFCEIFTLLLTGTKYIVQK